MSFVNKVVLVTGASSGIGAATAVLFAKEGAKVALVGRNEGKLNKVAEKCASHGNLPLIIKADIAKEEEAGTIVAKTVEKFGKLDVLVNNAGIVKNVSVADPEILKHYDAVMNVNLRAVVQITCLAIPHLEKTKGNVVNVSSVAAHCVLSPNSMPYAASKIALDHYTRCAAVDLAPSGVRVNSVNPGPVKTDILENCEVVQSGAGDQVWEHIKTLTLLDRVSEPEEVAELICFVASEKAKAITGSIFVTDNGMTLKKS